MHETDRLGLLAGLPTECCELNHGPGTSREDFPAVDYLVMPFGYCENEITEISVREMVIPVCGECAAALAGEEWTLLYCFECCSCQWVARAFAKNRYRHHILWLRGCPHCARQFGGLYFTDLSALAGVPTFLSRQPAVMAA
ncbi:MAG: hypothetical protein KKE83_02470 [Proteobacteria bacterium]|nr:hypothetical protein [Pseudomonadota bacterium]MBU1546725.1 hypothetical protein [Pseudomonadota bacterium]MBU2618530.1 hypothetical protein [Pseudomonadota bacterium]